MKKSNELKVCSGFFMPRRPNLPTMQLYISKRKLQKEIIEMHTPDTEITVSLIWTKFMSHIHYFDPLSLFCSPNCPTPPHPQPPQFVDIPLEEEDSSDEEYCPDEDEEDETAEEVKRLFICNGLTECRAGCV